MEMKKDTSTPILSTELDTNEETTDTTAESFNTDSLNTNEQMEPLLSIKQLNNPDLKSLNETIGQQRSTLKNISVDGWKALRRYEQTDLESVLQRAERLRSETKISYENSQLALSPEDMMNRSITQFFANFTQETDEITTQLEDIRASLKHALSDIEAKNDNHIEPHNQVVSDEDAAREISPNELGAAEHEQVPDVDPCLNEHPEFDQNNFQIDERKLSCIYGNMHSIVPKVHQTRKLLEDKRPAMVLMSETWLKEKHNSSDYIDGLEYEIFREDRPKDKKKHGGGVAAIYSTTLNVLRVDIPRTEMGNQFDILALDITHFNNTVRIGVVYLPPQSKVSTLNKLHEIIQKYFNVEFPCMIVGDTNLDLKDYKTQKQSTKMSRIYECFTKCGFKNYANFTTVHSKKWIDWVMFRGNNDTFLKNCKPTKAKYAVITSDHESIFMDLLL